MKRKTVLYIAMTLDGYIADDQDQIRFLDPYQGNKMAGESYLKLLSRIDTLIMGRKTFDILNQMVDTWPYPDLMTYVITSKKHESNEKILFVDHDHQSFIENLVGQPGKDIWIVGGGQLVSSLLSYDRIDEFQITVIPKLMEKGKPLFPEFENEIDLILDQTQVEDDLVLLTYHQKSKAL